MDDSFFYTCVARCKVCNNELNRVGGIPGEHRDAVSLVAPTVARCDVESHNSHNVAEKMNVNIVLSWYRETLNGLEFLETIETPGIQLA